MQAVILNSGMGSRMGDLTKNKHKSMVEIKDGLPLVIHQIRTLADCGISDFIITTGYMADNLQQCIESHFGSAYNFTFVYNEKYGETNYIYSLCLARGLIAGDTLLLHGDLYFTKDIIMAMLSNINSCVVTDTTLSLPEKDFKASICDNRVSKIGIYITGEGCAACQPLYKLNSKDMIRWLNQIKSFCENGNVNVYAEEALNVLLDTLNLYAYDLKGELCMEVDILEDLVTLRNKI